MAAGLLAVVLVASGCTTSPETTLEPVTADPEEFVVIGAGQADGTGVRDDLRNLWARRFLQELPQRTVYVNLARPGATAASALGDQAPTAVELEPELVAVWLGRADATNGVPPDEFGRDLTELVSAFDDSTEILLLTGWDDGDSALRAPYLDQILDVAARTVAVPVDVVDVDADAPDAQQRVADRMLEVHRSR